MAFKINLNKIKRLFLLVAILIMVYYTLKNYNEIKQFTISINYKFLALSFIFLLGACFIVPVVWHLITLSLDCNLNFKETIRIRLISEIGKYIPGRVFGYGYLIIHYKEVGKDQIKLLNSSIYEIYLATYSAFLFFTLTLLPTSFQIFNTYKIGFIAISLLGIVSLHPWFFQKMSDLFCKIFRKEKIKYRISYPKILGFLTLYLLFWVVFSLAFFLFVRSFTEMSFKNILYLSGSFAISTFAGFMAFFLPAGLGAREGLLIYLLASLTGNILALVISVGSRIWLIIADIVFFLVASFSKLLAEKK